MATPKPKAAEVKAANEAPAEAQTPATAEVATDVVENPAPAAPAAPTAPAAPAAPKSKEQPEHFDVRVLAPVTIAGIRYEPNDVIEGVPLALIEAYAGSVDDHPDAVTYARDSGGTVKAFAGPVHAED